MSAKNEQALRELAGRYEEFLSKNPDVDLSDVCFTANTARSRFNHRLAIVTESVGQLREQLSAFVSGQDAIAHLFTGEVSGIAKQPENLPDLPAPEFYSKLAHLYTTGVEIEEFLGDRDRVSKRIALPTYPFQRERYWLNLTQKEENSTLLSRDPNSHPLLHRRLSSPLKSLQFESSFARDRVPLVDDHRLGGLPVVNLVIYLEMALASAAEALDIKDCSICDISLPQALVLPEEGAKNVQFILTPEGDVATFQLFSQDAEQSWTLHGTGRLFSQQSTVNSQQSLNKVTEGQGVLPKTLEQARSQYSETLSSSEFYQWAKDRGVDLGESCQQLDRIWRKKGSAIGTIRPFEWENLDNEGYSFSLSPSPPVPPSSYYLPLGAIDAWIQLLSACFPPDLEEPYLLVGVERFSFYGDAPQPWWGEAELDGEEYGKTVVGNLRLFDATGSLVAEMVNLRLKRTQFAQLHPSRPVTSQGKSSFSQEQLLAAPLEERQSLLEAYLIETLARSLQLPASKFTPQDSLATIVDSLMAMELRSRIETDLQLSVSLDQFFNDCSIAQLATTLLDRIAIASLIPSTPPQPDEEMEEITL